jgi:hypothetical protein
LSTIILPAVSPVAYNGRMAETLTSDAIRAAINEILTDGQEVTVGDRTYRAANLNDLQKLLQETVAEERQAAGTMFVRASFGRVR